MLTAEQLAHREYRVTASFLPALMAGNDADILNEWRRLVGDPAYAPKKLTWAMHHGSICEGPALDWHEDKTGEKLIRRGETVVHPTRDWFACTLDAYRASDDCVIDVKCPGGHMRLDEIESYYTPQVIGQMGCVGARSGALLVVHGGAEPIELPIEPDSDYVEVLWRRVDGFQRCVETLTPPVLLRSIAAPERWRKIDLDVDRSANWAQPMIDQLFLWSATRKAHREHEEAKEAIKELLPGDVGEVRCAGLQIKRARNNAVSIRHE